ncbi:MAG: hypothetical protein Q7K20_04980 [Polaromonas sp.]|nr:hypothetical protein [Polaromonas sp.]
MKTILTVLAVAGLSGCAVYPVPGYEQPYGAGPVYGAPPPAVIYGSGVYRQGGYIEAPPPVYVRPPPVYVRPPPPRIVVQPAPQVLVQPGPRPQSMVARPGHRGRDQDRDGVPDRVDRDRDGDGVPNRMDRDRDGDGTRNRADRRPNDPRVR